VDWINHSRGHALPTWHSRHLVGGPRRPAFQLAECWTASRLSGRI